jgi:hypothetical protein
MKGANFVVISEGLNPVYIMMVIIRFKRSPQGYSSMDPRLVPQFTSSKHRFVEGRPTFGFNISPK